MLKEEDDYPDVKPTFFGGRSSGEESWLKKAALCAETEEGTTAALRGVTSGEEFWLEAADCADVNTRHIPGGNVARG